MVREVALADGEEARYGGHELVVHPDASHGVVYGGVYHHRVIVLHAVDFVGQLSGVDVGYLLIHVEEVAVALQHHVDAQALDALGEVEEHGASGVVHAEALVAALLGCAAGHVAGHEVAECRVAALEVVVAVFLGDVAAFLGACLQCLGVFNFLGHPDAAVVAQRL